MANEQPLDAKSTLGALPAPFTENIDEMLTERLAKLNRKVIALDDDPTGVQTVHDVSVYTNWDLASIQGGFGEEEDLFFLLTNSRAFSRERTEEVHLEIAKNIAVVAKTQNKGFLLISRSDSTLRGHYPLETATLRDTLEAADLRYDGEVIIPFFLEGGRYTMNNVHYVREGDVLVPAGQTEFAKDKSFGYASSHLGEWCEEKTGGAYLASGMTYISLDDLRSGNIDAIKGQLMAVKDFGKVIVNAASYEDVKVFAVACLDAILSGREFLFRGAAAITRVLGNISARPLLKRQELIEKKDAVCGVVIAGSHVNRTTRQLDALKALDGRVEFIVFDQHQVMREGGLKAETKRCIHQARECMNAGKSVVISTRRERFDLPTRDEGEQLRVSVEIADALTGVIAGLERRPDFLIAKGGITSSDVGTKALKARRARVMGQIKPGIPVWKTGAESTFPFIPFIIFPGNVGDDDTLLEIVEELIGN